MEIKNVNIVKPVNLYECEIGDNSIIQSYTFICELVTIVSNVCVYHGVTFMNDKLKTE